MCQGVSASVIARAQFGEVHLARTDLTEALLLKESDCIARRQRALVNLSLGLYEHAIADRNALKSCEWPVSVILPLQLIAGLSVVADDGTRIQLSNGHPLELRALEQHKLRVGFVFENQHFDALQTSIKIIPCIIK